MNWQGQSKRLQPVSFSKKTVMMGVLIFFDALMISLMRGTPRVMFMEATPAKWNVFRVIWVPGSPMLWAQRAPTAVPGSMVAETTSTESQQILPWTK